MRAQTRPAEEIIVVDDGSTDGTPEWLAETHPDVRVIAQKNLGASSARNAGVRASEGSFIAFLDSDDEWLPEKLARQVELIESDNGSREVTLCHTDEIWIRNGRRVNPMKKHRKHGGFIFERALPLCIISPSSVLIRRELFDDVGYFDESLPACEDYDLWLRVTARFAVDYIDEKLIIKYGGHEDQLSRRYPAMDRFRIRALEKILRTTVLDEMERRAAEEMLSRKRAIYARGALKRGRPAYPVP